MGGTWARLQLTAEGWFEVILLPVKMQDNLSIPVPVALLLGWRCSFHFNFSPFEWIVWHFLSTSLKDQDCVQPELFFNSSHYVFFMIFCFCFGCRYVDPGTQLRAWFASWRKYSGNHCTLRRKLSYVIEFNKSVLFLESFCVH